MRNTELRNKQKLNSRETLPYAGSKLHTFLCYDNLRYTHYGFSTRPSG